jgi:hypothetical protein
MTYDPEGIWGHVGMLQWHVGMDDGWGRIQMGVVKEPFMNAK